MDKHEQLPHTASVQFAILQLASCESRPKQPNKAWHGFGTETPACSVKSSKFSEAHWRRTIILRAIAYAHQVF